MSFKRRSGKLRAHRQHGRLVDYQGTRARVLFGDGNIKALSAEPFRMAGLEPGGWFVLIVHRKPGGELVTKGHNAPRILRVTPPKGAAPRTTTPAIYVKDGRAVTTRR